MPEVHAADRLQTRGADDPAWLEFVGTHPDATIFHHAAWSQVLADAYGYRPLSLVLPSPEGEVQAGLPVLELPGRRFAALPFTDACAPLYADPNRPERFAVALQQWREASGARQLVVHASLGERDGIQERPRAVRHLLPLADSVPAQLDRLRGSQVQRAIKKAEREGVTTTLGRSRDELRSFLRLHALTRHRQGVPMQPQRFFDAMWRRLIDRDLGFIVLAAHRGRVIAGALYLHWNGTLVYKFGASDPRAWALRPNNLVMWTAIAWGCEHACRVLDFGRTDLENTGLREFKRRWGATELPLAYAYLPPGGPVGVSSLAFRAASRLIRSSPPIVGRLTGELLYGRVPGFAS